MSDWINFFLSVKDVRWLDFQKIFSFKYLSDTALSFSSPLVALLGYIFLAIIIVGIIFNIVLGKKNKKMPVYSKISVHITNMTLWLGIIGLILVISRFQGINILSSRFLLFADLLALVIWTAWIVYYAVTKIPKMKKNYIKKQTKEKYLPKKKKIRL